MVEGEVTAAFAPVRGALEGLERADGRGGIAVAAFVGGDLAVDLWCGNISRDSLVHTFSAVKPVAGTCLLQLAERHQLSLKTKVASLWPELEAARSGELRVRHLLTHSAGLASIPAPGTAVSLLDWPGTIGRLSAAVPDFVPGEAIAEHAYTFGHLVGEVLRRANGRSLGRYLDEELAGPLGLDVHIGLDPSELERVADTVGCDAAFMAARRGPEGTLRHRAIAGDIDDELVNSAAWRSAEVPAVNGHATARGLASFYARLLEGALPEGVDAPGPSGFDLVMEDERTWTLAGGTVEGAVVGMGGLGGQWAAAHRDTGLAWAFLTTSMGDHERAQLIEDSLLACLESG